MSSSVVGTRRLAAQQITRHDHAMPEALVAWLGAVQAQDYAAAKWALGLRLAGGSREAMVAAALAEGRILRTHAMRGTWQFVTPADLRWILPLTTPRVIAGSASRYRELGLEPRVVRRALAAMEKALAHGEHLTRAELGAALKRAKLPSEGQALGHLLGRAEMEAVICSGAPKGKQQSYALFDTRVPAHATLDRDEALERLARRYFQSRSPATAHDFAWWSGLTIGDGKRALAAIGPLPDAPPAPRTAKNVIHLLPAFDEFLVGYSDRDAVLDPAEVARFNAGGGMLNPVMVQKGQVIGTWRRTIEKKQLKVALTPFRRAEKPEPRALARALDRYAAFLGLSIHTPARAGVE